MGGVNPQGCQVFSFKKPSDEESALTFWRFMKRCPSAARSASSTAFTTRMLETWSLRAPEGAAELLGKNTWKERFDDINAFERHLV
jgi:polyphosphate kinase 2 (PPK2 family)